jgi:anti-anti-sigma factor
LGKPYAIRVDSYAGTTTIRLRGDIDSAASRDVRAAIADSILADPPDRLVIDLTAVTFIDTDGVDALSLARHAAAFIRARLEITPSAATGNGILELSELHPYVAREPLRSVG